MSPAGMNPACAGDRGQDARLRRHLAGPGAFATPSALGCGRIALFRSKDGVSLGAGYVEAAAAAALVVEGVARWTKDKPPRLVAALPQGAKAELASRTVIVEGVAQIVTFDERESPLLWLHRRMGKDGKPQISAAQFAAGERFRADLTLAQMLPRTTMNWDASLRPDAHGAGGHDPASASDAALAARQRVRKACDRLGPDLSGLAIDVCGFLKGLDQIERERDWPARSAKVVLRLALSALDAHYGIGGRLASGPARVAAWQAPDARPGIMPAGTAPR